MGEINMIYTHKINLALRVSGSFIYQFSVITCFSQPHLLLHSFGTLMSPQSKRTHFVITQIKTVIPEGKMSTEVQCRKAIKFQKKHNRPQLNEAILLDSNLHYVLLESSALSAKPHSETTKLSSQLGCSHSEVIVAQNIPHT